MDELINMVAQKTGISQDQAKTAVNTVLGFLKERLPASIGSHLDGVVGGGGSSASGLGGLEGVAGSLGGILGGKNE